MISRETIPPPFQNKPTEIPKHRKNAQQIQRFRDSEIQRFRDSEIQRFRDSEIQRFRDSEIQQYTSL
ncbi:hypothetical protein C5H13_10510 [Xylella fastidiosa]|nr:hypothetical protein C5H13_10510 [Xylella fastidiosa]